MTAGLNILNGNDVLENVFHEFKLFKFEKQ
jgi:hypothetical protein